MADLTAYPIIFSAPMVKALLDGRKSQTRRPAWQECKTAKQALRSDVVTEAVRNPDGILEARNFIPSVWQKRHDKFHAGERPWLWVRETCSATETHDGLDAVRYNADQMWRPIADTREAAEQWMTLFHYRGERGALVPSIHMPKWASRLSLHVTDMRIERLQDISEKDALAEGVRRNGDMYSVELREGPRDQRSAVTTTSPIGTFATLWNSIHGFGAWAENPEVVVTVFKPHLQNIGSVT